MPFSPTIPFVTDVRVAVARDLPYILDLHKKNGDALGFLPRQAFEKRVEQKHVIVARENGEHCGYLLTNGLTKNPKITHACIQYDARGRLHGFALVHRYIRELLPAGGEQLTLRCRDGLPSNDFWAEAGFTLLQLVPGGLSAGRMLNNWAIDLTALPADSPYHHPGPHENLFEIGGGPLRSQKVQVFPTMNQTTAAIPHASLAATAAALPKRNFSTRLKPGDRVARDLDKAGFTADSKPLPMNPKATAQKIFLPPPPPAGPPPVTHPRQQNPRQALQDTLAARHVSRHGSAVDRSVMRRNEEQEKQMSPAQRQALAAALLAQRR
jgi:hypothetical protein